MWPPIREGLDGSKRKKMKKWKAILFGNDPSHTPLNMFKWQWSKLSVQNNEISEKSFRIWWSTRTVSWKSWDHTRLGLNDTMILNYWWCQCGSKENRAKQSLSFTFIFALSNRITLKSLLHLNQLFAEKCKTVYVFGTLKFIWEWLCTCSFNPI